MQTQYRLATALGTSMLFLVPGAALAQSSFDWSGFYAGVSGGIAYSDAPVNIETTTISDVFNVYPIYGTGALVGLTGGYNWQMDDFVIGIEADGSYTTLRGGQVGSPAIEVGLDALLTLRGRLGYSVGNALFYGTGGVAVGRAFYTVTGGASGPAAAEGIVAGLVGGVGAEVALNDNLSIKGEGLMYQTSSLSDVSDNGKDTNYAPRGIIVRAGANVHF